VKVSKRRYRKEEIAELGDRLFQAKIAKVLQDGDEGQFVAIDVESEEFEMGDDEQEAGQKLISRIPGAQIWMVRVGSRVVHRFGGRQPRKIQ
jgi:hypothetical protein